MKRAIILLAALVLIWSSASSQGVSVGLKAGLNLAKESFSFQGASINTDNLTSFHGGLYVTIMTSAKFGIQPELLYSGQGGSGSNGKGGTSNLKLGYLNLPVMLRYNVTPMFSLQAGPQLGILLSATDDTGDIKSQFASTDFGGAFGAALDLPMGLNFTFRYITGFTGIYSPDTSFPGLTLTTTNQVIQLSAGFKLSGK